MKHLGIGIVACAVLSAPARGTGTRPGNPPPTRVGPATSAPAVQAPTSFPVLLWDQTDNPAGGNVGSQDFEPLVSIFDDEAADDFVVPAGSVWSVEEAFVSGGYNPGGGPAAALNVYIYSDAGGTPGDVLCNYPLLTPIDSAGSFLITFPHACVLRAGTYWLSAQARQDLAPSGQWYRNTRLIQSGNESRWRNPSNGYSTGCLGFSPVSSCLPGTAKDLLFWIAGTPGGDAPPGPPECGTSTAYFENGTPVAIADQGVTTSTIDVSGVGSSVWDVNAVTFLRHTFSGDLDVTITSPAGTVVTLTTDNGGSNDDVFDGTVWDDQANPGVQVPYTSNPGLVGDYAYVNGFAASPLAPEEALSAFMGENPNGTWTITISDDASGDFGALTAWGLQITTLQNGITTSTTSFHPNDAPVPIPDLGGVISNIDASSHHGTFLCRLRVTTAITHTFPGDLDMTVESPLGTIVTLTTDNAGTNDDAFNGTTWEDGVNPGGQVPYSTNDGLVTDTAYVSGTPVLSLVPEEALAAFIGEDPRGTWTLTISDDAAGDAGMLDSWSLEVKTCTCAAAQQDVPLRVDAHASSGGSNLNGVFEAGETVLVEPSWHNAGMTPFDLSGYVTTFYGPPGPIYTVDDPIGNYASVAPGATVNCFDATGDCYQLTIGAGSRPAQHWDTTFQEAAAEISGPERPERPSAPETVLDRQLHIGESFPDVATASLFYPFVENIFHHGVTGGCSSAPNYCPGDVTLRKQMAVFVLKAKEGASYAPPAAVGVFTDVPAGDPFAPWIEELFHRGVVTGCGAGPTYCPSNPVLRQQMAIFLLKTLLGSGYTPPAAAGLFGDVPVSSPFAPWIEDLFNRGIGAGCGGGNFCPTTSTTRGQMAPFLVKTFSLALYGP